MILYVQKSRKSCFWPFFQNLNEKRPFFQNLNEKLAKNPENDPFFQNLNEKLAKNPENAPFCQNLNEKVQNPPKIAIPMWYLILKDLGSQEKGSGTISTPLLLADTTFYSKISYIFCM